MEHASYLKDLTHILQTIVPSAPTISYDTHLVRDLDFDSVSLLSFAVAVENHWQIAMQEDLQNPPLTVRDVITLILRAQAKQAGCSYDIPLTLPTMNLLHFFRNENKGTVSFANSQGEIKSFFYQELREKALKVAAYLQNALPAASQERNIAIILPTTPAFYAAFFGSQLVGHVPCALYPPLRFGKLDEWKEKTLRMLETIDAPIILSEERLLPLLQCLNTNEHPRHLFSLEKILQIAPATDFKSQRPTSNTAFIQFSSGSTGHPKALSISHRQVLYNLDSILDQFQRFGLELSDLSCMSWLPLYHDMGLVGTMLAGLVTERPLTLLSPEEFIKRPALWPQLMSKTKASISLAPNFAFGLAAEKGLSLGLDLSHWKVALCGAEPIHRRTLEYFCQTFASSGFDKKAIIPVYGLAEATLAVSFATPGSWLEASSPSLSTSPSVGKAVKHTHISLNEQGEVLVSSPSTITYPEPLATGDLGELDQEGNLTLKGRLKDIIIIRGRNYDPAPIEDKALFLCEKEKVPVRKGQAVAFGVNNEESGTEEIVLLLEKKERKNESALAIKKQLQAELTLPIKELCFLASGTLPKTSSGKIKRAEAKKAYLEQTLTPPHPYPHLLLCKEYLKGKWAALKSATKTNRHTDIRP